MKKGLTSVFMLIISLVLLQNNAFANLDNFGFENGNTNGWSEVLLGGGSVEVVTSHVSNLGSLFSAPVGNYFVKVRGGQNSFNQNIFNSVVGSFNIEAGSKVNVWSAYDNRFGSGTDDAFAAYSIFANNVFISETLWERSVTDTGLGGDSPWSLSSFIAPATGLYSFQFAVRSDNGTFALFDTEITHPVVPEPASIVLFGAGLAGMYLKRRKI